MAMPGINMENAKAADQAILSGLLDINSIDPIEGMLAAQIIAAHEASMRLRQLAWLPEQSLEAMTKFLELAEKAARTVGILTERLDQHRGRGQQQITVKHVTVNADQALVADNITTGTPSQSSPARTPGNLLTTGGQKAMEILDGDLVAVGGKKKNEHRPHAKRARRSPVWSQIKKNWEALPGTGSSRQPRLPDAWRWRWWPAGAGKWKLPSRRADKRDDRCCPLYQCAGEECS
jgi:hypothetical protein